MGLFGEMGKPEEKSELPKEEKKHKFEQQKKQKKGKIASIIKGKRIIIDVDGFGESIPYNEKEHGHLKIDDIIIF